MAFGGQRSRALGGARLGARLRPGVALTGLLAAAALSVPAAALGAGSTTTPTTTSPTATTPTTTTPTPNGTPTPGPNGTHSKAHGNVRPDVILSNERTHTTFSIADRLARIRTSPNAHSRALAKLQYSTPDGFSQTYLLLREHWVGRTAWVKLRIPMRPNGKVGWVLLRDLDQFQVSRSELIVNRASHRLTLYRNGKVIYTAPVGVGKPSTPTPGGHFWITESFSSSVPAYGPWAFGTSDYSVLSDWPGGGIVGLHGTDEPSLVPGNPSHGCIRLHNRDAVALSKLVQIGTPLWVK